MKCFRHDIGKVCPECGFDRRVTPMGVAIANAILVGAGAAVRVDILKFTEALGDAGYYVAPLEQRE